MMDDQNRLILSIFIMTTLPVISGMTLFVLAYFTDTFQEEIRDTIVSISIYMLVAAHIILLLILSRWCASEAE